MSALSDFRAAIVARVAALTDYEEVPGGDATQVPDHWVNGFVVDMPEWAVDGDGSVKVCRGPLAVELWYRTDQLAFEQGDWMTAWEALSDQLEAASWTVSGSATIVVVGAETERTDDRFIGRLLAEWTLTYSR